VLRLRRTARGGGEDGDGEQDGREQEPVQGHGDLDARARRVSLVRYPPLRRPATPAGDSLGGHAVIPVM
jgi:hypothetical protein